MKTKNNFDSDTFAKGPGSTVAKVVDGSVFGQTLAGIAGVANTGSDRNWTRHLLGEANWFAFGRLAWNPDLAAKDAPHPRRDQGPRCLWPRGGEDGHSESSESN